MPDFVLDASVAISWCFPGNPTENTPYSQRILEELVASDAVVPEIWAFEIANNVFVSHMRRRRIDEAQIIEYLDLLGRLPIRVESQPWMDSVRLESAARRWNLAAYDAAYLSLALKRGIPLATSDAALRAKAIEIGVGILS